MFVSRRPPIAQNQIPKIKELQELLGFDGTNGRSPADLKDSTHHFRKEYLTSDGTPGRNLKDWKTPRTQNELLRMARTFLDDEHYGMKYWPATVSTLSRHSLRQPRDSDRLAELLQQLFWRQNIYSARNANHPDRGRQVRESVESDQSSVTIQPKKSHSTQHPRFFNLSDQVLQRLPSWVGTIDTQSTATSQDESNSSGLPSPQYETTNPVEQCKSTLSTTHARLGISNNPERNAPAATTAQPPYFSANAGSPDNIELPEDIFDSVDNDKKPAPHNSGPSKGPNKATVNQGEEDEDIQIERPRSRGVAPKAKMLASQEAKMLAAQQDPITPDQKDITKKASSSKSKPSTEPKGAKRKDVDDDSEYTPSKKLKGKRIFSNIAWSKPKRRRTEKPQDNGVQQSSSLTGERLTSPVATFAGTLENTDHVRSLQAANLVAGEPSVLGRPSTPENQNISIEKSPSLPRRTPLLDKLKARRNQEKSRLESTNQPDQGQRQSVLNFSPACKTVETRLESGETPPMATLDTRIRDTANETPSPPESNLNTGNQAAAGGHDQAISTDANIMEQPIVRSQTARSTGLATPEPGQDEPPPQSPDLRIEIRYYIIASRAPRLVKRHWPIQSLSGKTVQTLFSEVSMFTSKPDIQRIVLKLNLSRADSEYTIQRNDARTFEAMTDDFVDDIKRDWRDCGNTKFSILLEPDPVEGGIRMDAGDLCVAHEDATLPRIMI